jgi:hypothetical protein
MCRPVGVWAEQRADDGRRYYWNKYANTSKWELDAEEKKYLVPNLDSYDNPMVMSLQVGPGSCGSLGSSERSGCGRGRGLSASC